MPKTFRFRYCVKENTHIDGKFKNIQELFKKIINPNESASTSR